MDNIRISRRALLGGFGAVGTLAVIGPVIPQFTTPIEPLLSNYDNSFRDLIEEIKNKIAKNMQYHLFEPNDAFTRYSLADEIRAYLEELYNYRRLHSYHVFCDSINNPRSEIDHGYLNLDVYLKPVRSVEYTTLNAKMARQGMSFEETMLEVAQ